MQEYYGFDLGTQQFLKVGEYDNLEAALLARTNPNIGFIGPILDWQNMAQNQVILRDDRPDGTNQAFIAKMAEDGSVMVERIADQDIPWQGVRIKADGSEEEFQITQGELDAVVTDGEDESELDIAEVGPITLLTFNGETNRFDKLATYDSLSEAREAVSAMEDESNYIIPEEALEEIVHSYEDVLFKHPITGKVHYVSQDDTGFVSGEGTEQQTEYWEAHADNPQAILAVNIG